MNPTISRVSNRAKREVIAKFPPASRWVQARRTARLEGYRSQLPSLEEPQRRRVQQLEGDGIVAGPWDELGLPGVEEVKPLLTALADALAGRPARRGDGASTMPLSREETLEDPRLFQWGLQDQVLDVVENYLGVPAHYYGPLVRRELADARVVSTRRWHRDIEDHRVLKILVWLNDVDREGGPFTYAPLGASLPAVRQLRYVGGFVDDHRFAAAVPQHEWRQATGPRWTAVVPDTARIFHRAQAPVARDRYSLTFTWTSRSPVTVIDEAPWRPDQLRHAVRHLGSRQLASLSGAMQASIA